MVLGKEQETIRCLVGQKGALRVCYVETEKYRKTGKAGRGSLGASLSFRNWISHYRCSLGTDLLLPCAFSIF